MLGAIIGDICGSVYEWHNEKNISNIQLFKRGCYPTDDSIMTIAVAQALLDSEGNDDDMKRDVLVNAMHYYGRLFPDAGYGGTFGRWLHEYDRYPYNSWGNGSGMRVAAAGWLCDSYEDTLHLAKLTAEVTHNHPEGIKGAQSIAAAIYLARKGNSKQEIKIAIARDFYDICFTLDEIRPEYEFDVSCQGSCPVAIEAFLESESFEDAIKLAISVGGDSDTIAAMTGAIAEAYYGISDEIRNKTYEVLHSVSRSNVVYHNEVLREVIDRFSKRMGIKME